jgi:hypothetical protein
MGLHLDAAELQELIFTGLQPHRARPEPHWTSTVSPSKEPSTTWHVVIACPGSTIAAVRPLVACDQHPRAGVIRPGPAGRATRIEELIVYEQVISNVAVGHRLAVAIDKNAPGHARPSTGASSAAGVRLSSLR